MNKLSYTIAVVTILVSRITLHILESHDINDYAYFLGIRWHHIYTGTVLVAIGWLIPKKSRLKPVLFGVGAGLMIDEAFFPLNFYGFSNFTYWYPGSLVIAAMVLVATYFFIIKE